MTDLTLIQKLRQIADGTAGRPDGCLSNINGWEPVLRAIAKESANAIEAAALCTPEADKGEVPREVLARTIRAAMMPESAKQKHWSLFYKAADAILALRASPAADAGIAGPAAEPCWCRNNGTCFWGCQDADDEPTRTAADASEALKETS